MFKLKKKSINLFYFLNSEWGCEKYLGGPKSICHRVKGTRNQYQFKKQKRNNIVVTFGNVKTRKEAQPVSLSCHLVSQTRIFSVCDLTIGHFLLTITLPLWPVTTNKHRYNNKLEINLSRRIRKANLNEAVEKDFDALLSFTAARIMC